MYISIVTVCLTSIHLTYDNVLDLRMSDDSAQVRKKEKEWIKRRLFWCHFILFHLNFLNLIFKQNQKSSCFLLLTLSLTYLNSHKTHKKILPLSCKCGRNSMSSHDCSFLLNMHGNMKNKKENFFVPLFHCLLLHRRSFGEFSKVEQNFCMREKFSSSACYSFAHQTLDTIRNSLHFIH